MDHSSPYSTPESDINLAQESTYQPLFLSFNGRIGRLRYLAYIMSTYLIFMLFIALMVGVSSFKVLDPESGIIAGFSNLTVVMTIPVVVFIVGISIRRLNDLAHTGWLIILSLIPVIGWILNLYLVFAEGTKGANKYGAPPCENPLSVKVLGLGLPALIIVGTIVAMFV